MATHDLRCTSCGYVYRDVNISVIVGAKAYCRETFCNRCGTARGLTLEPIPAIRLSLFSDAESRSSPHDFTKATVQVEDASPQGFHEVVVSSLRDIRRLERESEQAERNGEGRRMVWRDYSQDHSNQLVHTLGEDPSLKPAKHYTNGTPVVVRKGDPVTADHGTIED